MEKDHFRIMYVSLYLLPCNHTSLCVVRDSIVVEEKCYNIEIYIFKNTDWTLWILDGQAQLCMRWEDSSFQASTNWGRLHQAVTFDSVKKLKLYFGIKEMRINWIIPYLWNTSPLTPFLRNEEVCKYRADFFCISTRPFLCIFWGAALWISFCPKSREQNSPISKLKSQYFWYKNQLELIF